MKELLVRLADAEKQLRREAAEHAVVKQEAVIEKVCSAKVAKCCAG
jgi:F0F1-type ATP synthase membrane subunit b/b'